jgi:hypothetical protein
MKAKNVKQAMDNDQYVVNSIRYKKIKKYTMILKINMGILIILKIIQNFLNFGYL